MAIAICRVKPAERLAGADPMALGNKRERQVAQL
jgi:hypothetical protein